MIFRANVADQAIELEVNLRDGYPEVTIQNRTPHLDIVRLSTYSYSLLVDGHSYLLSIRPSRDGFIVDLRRRTYFVRLRDETDLTIERLGMKNSSRNYSGQVLAPIPGLITSLAVSEGEQVAAGDQLLVLEAMKMENEIASPMNGVIKTVHVSVGMAVEKGTVLIDLLGQSHS